MTDSRFSPRQPPSRRRLPRAALAGLVLAASALVLSACSNTPSRSTAQQDPMAALQERVEAYWQHLIAREYDQAYTYLTPGYRSTYSEEDFSRINRRNPVSWERAQWQEAECETVDSCQVTLLATYSVRMPGAGRVQSMRQQPQRWIRSQNQWYHLPER